VLIIIQNLEGFVVMLMEKPRRWNINCKNLLLFKTFISIEDLDLMTNMGRNSLEIFLLQYRLIDEDLC
jgi:hypothetical protein